MLSKLIQMIDKIEPNIDPISICLGVILIKKNLNNRILQLDRFSIESFNLFE